MSKKGVLMGSWLLNARRKWSRWVYCGCLSSIDPAVTILPLSQVELETVNATWCLSRDFLTMSSVSQTPVEKVGSVAQIRMPKTNMLRLERLLVFGEQSVGSDVGVREVVVVIVVLFAIAFVHGTRDIGDRGWCKMSWSIRVAWLCRKLSSVVSSA
jgi:hypothetical protein